jgi:hypothetical protein
VNRYFKKSWSQRLRDAFTKTRGQIYREFSIGEKISYIVLVTLGFLLIAWVWIFKLHML